jgi:hypothetical protein
MIMSGRAGRPAPPADAPEAPRPDAIQIADEPEAVRLEAVRTEVGQRGALDTEAV